MPQAPIAEGLFEVVGGIPHLIGGRRKSDGKVVFPMPDGPEGAHYESLRLSPEGRLWSYTVQRFRPKSPPYASEDDEASFRPYALGYVELAEVIVEGRIDTEDFEALKVGMPMRLRLVPFRKQRGQDVLAYAFEPVP